MSKVLFDKVKQLLELPNETEWVEFKMNKADPDDIGEYISALSNSATLHGQKTSYIIWGVHDELHKVSGTRFKPRELKIGNEELECWLSTHLQPRIDFRIHEINYQHKPMVVFEIPPCQHTPVRFKDFEYIRVGTYKKKLKDYPEKERSLWMHLAKASFEKGVAMANIMDNQVLQYLDYPAFFEMLGYNLPDNKAGIIEQLKAEKIIKQKSSNKFDITNFGAILFAKNLLDFDAIASKAVRVIIYDGINRIRTIKEQEGIKGYANGFNGLISYINDQLPMREQIGQAFREEVKVYPEEAIRELVPNALIHQDFNMTGTGPMIEIFSDRIEFTNPGKPLIDSLRFVDEPPQSRNEKLAKFMKKIKICEERGSGFDKVVFYCEYYKLPAPEVIVTDNHTKVVLYAYKSLDKMSSKEKNNACYLHACLKRVQMEQLTNSSLRERFGIEEHNKSIVSRIIRDTVNCGLIKPFDPDSKSRKYQSYVPFWA
ncbi:putative DNA binding domain-containing protein [bacterium]|nr:putative DNA binding domain-containing protein [bacterium]